MATGEQGRCHLVIGRCSFSIPGYILIHLITDRCRFDTLDMSSFIQHMQHVKITICYTPRFANIVKQSWVSEVSQSWPASRACLRALEALPFLTITDEQFYVIVQNQVFCHKLENVLSLLVHYEKVMKISNIRVVDNFPKLFPKPKSITFIPS